ncbi:zeta toxin family protein [Blastopirellula marina]|uniref:Zeta toxin domain-containing protein n=1 Tax=Blastopirellula marina TaxID=124 RepID=A0A2S8FWH0_9BACT|nr:zeta toxin family protein [Blastopirellula marina]PQO36532.1 hypothetical protein C5Y98_12605 [Blastopirellula marina]PTL44371.1 hypothetical protein C5Y97_12615 [Blastopirellula marina]
MSDKQPPSVIVIAGPNGAGKSTLAPYLLRDYLDVRDFVNADVIAQGLSAYDPDAVAIEAGRIMVARLQELAHQRKSFAWETTLASRSYAKRLSKLKASGFQTHLVFIGLPDPEIAVQRVAARVARGGHNIPDEVIRRRYWAGLANLVDLYLPIVDSCDIVNGVNALDGARVSRDQNGRIELRPGDPPAVEGRKLCSEIARKLADRQALLQLARRSQLDAIRRHIFDGVPYVTYSDGEVVRELTMRAVEEDDR